MNAQSASTTRSQHLVPRVAEADSRFSRNYPGLLASLGCAAFLLVSAPALAAVTPNVPTLGAAGGYTVLGRNTISAANVTCTNTGTGSTINGAVGTTFTSIVNTTGCTINGVIVAPVPALVVNDFDTAYGLFDTQNPTCDTLNGTLQGESPLPSVYCLDTSGKTGVLTLTGTATDIWIFKINDAAGLAGNSLTVNMGGAAQACNVYWWTAPGAAATMTDSTFKGTILSGAAITTTNGSYLGRALAKTNVTVTDAAPMTFAGCVPEAGSITINKTAVGGNATFGYTASPALGTTSFNIATSGGTGSHVTTGLSANTYTVTESTVPAGWAQTGLACADSSGAGSTFTISGAQATINFHTGGIVTCTYTNTINSNTITVNKDFIPNSTATVPVGLICTSGTVTTPSLNAAEGAPAVFTVTGASTGATCTATETTVPAGYTANQTNCENVELNHSCTITNTLILPLTAIPTLAEWALIMLAMLLLVTGWLQYRRRQ